MHTDFPKNFIDEAGEALQQADKSIAVLGKIRGETGGIRRSDDERFFQSVIWKATYTRWPCRMNCRMGEDERDLVIFRDSLYTTAICEFDIKKWLSNGFTENEKKGIKKDIERLRNCQTPDSVLIILSANNRRAMHDQLEYFEAEIFNQERPRPETCCFPILYTNGEEQEFWIAAWPIKSGPLFQKQ